MEIRDFQQAKRGLWEKIRSLNARLPWLKLVFLLVLVVVIALSVEEVLRQEAGKSVESGMVGTDGGEMSENGGEEKPELPEITKERIVFKHSEEDEEPEVPVIPSVPEEQYTGKKLVALTFDDGPSSATTPRLLQILQEKGVKATFFVVGTMVTKSPEIVKQEARAGHEVGSHTMTHANLPKVGVAGIQQEVKSMDDLLMSTLGEKPSIMRPPYGSVDNTVRQTVPQPMILWTVDPEDWKYRDAAAVRAKVVGATFDGAIVLMHDIHASTVDAVPGIIDDLRAQGYEFVTVSELAKLRGVEMSGGVAYGSFRP